MIARILQAAPTPEARTAVLPVIDVEFGPPLDNAHPRIFEEFLVALGTPAEDVTPDPDLDNGPCREEVAALRSMSWCELLARILVGETQGPVVFPVISEALSRNYGLTKKEIFYFTLHAAHDKKDTEILIRLIVEQARTETDRRAVIETINRSFDEGRYTIHACQLEPEPRYSYTAQFRAKA
ncbi:MAG: iron-containing redox enzyme family protein [Proteobacteria bacterium]|nr:iron-containing redox enzyme family protein [Pseudomonadota bacterium]